MKVWGLAVLVCSACAAAPVVPIPPLPSAGGPAWTELQSEHFTMWTDASLPRGHALLREMEHLREVVYGVAFPGATNRGRTLVVAFRNSAEVGAYVEKQFVARAYTAGGGIFQPMIVIDANADEDDRRIIAHELTHVISYDAIPDQPHWFSEGLAGFFETVSLDNDREIVDVGEPQPWRIEQFHHFDPRPMASVFACDRPECMDDQFYATTWLLYAYLANVHPTELVAFEAGLAEVGSAGAAALWQQVFPALPPGKLDDAMRAWLAHGRHQVWHYKAHLGEPHITTRPLRDAGALAARGVLSMYAHRDGPEPPELAALLALEPTHLIAQLLHAQKVRAVEPSVARAVISAHPEDWRAWWLLSMAVRGEESLTARERLCALVPDPRVVPGGVCRGEGQPRSVVPRPAP